MENKTFGSTADKKFSQKSNKDWWEKNPMTYQFDNENVTEETRGFSKSPPKPSELTKEWFEKLDGIFFEQHAEFTKSEPKDSVPFSKLVDFSFFTGKKVLEIGCGMGSHSGLISQFASELIAIDLTQTAVDITNKRFELFDIKNATAYQVDAEDMPFEDGEFDFVWSWGVIHHSASTDLIVDQIQRVLKDGGKAFIMVYHKNSTRYYLHGLYQGIFRLKFLKHRSLYEVNMTFTDGYNARHYTQRSGKELFKKFKKIETIVVDCGVPTLVIGWGRLTGWFPGLLNPINKWIKRKFGWFLIINVEK